MGQDAWDWEVLAFEQRQCGNLIFGDLHDGRSWAVLVDNSVVSLAIMAGRVQAWRGEKSGHRGFLWIVLLAHAVGGRESHRD